MRNDSNPIELKFELYDFLDSEKIFEHINDYINASTDLDFKLLTYFKEKEETNLVDKNVHIPIEGLNMRSDQQYKTKLTKTEENMGKERKIYYKKYLNLDGMQLLSIYNK